MENFGIKRVKKKNMGSVNPAVTAENVITYF